MARILVLVVALALAGCASAPRLEVASAPKKLKATDELECMVECLEDGSEDCEGCAERCLERRGDGDVVASFKL